MAENKKKKTKTSPPSGTTSSTTPTTTSPTTTVPKKSVPQTGTTSSTVPKKVVSTSTTVAPTRTMPQALAPLGGPPIKRITPTTTIQVPVSTVPKVPVSTVPATQTSPIATQTAPIAESDISSLEQFDTREEFASNMSWLLKRINDTEKIIKTAPSMSERANQALSDRAELLYTFVKNQISATKKFGSYGVGPDGKLGKVKNVSKSMTNLLSALENPKTRQQASFVAAPLAAKINMAGGKEQQKNPQFYQLNADPKIIARAVKIGGGTPSVSPTGPTGPAITKPGGGTPTVIGSIRTVKGSKQTWNGTKWVSEKVATVKKAVNWEPKFREMFPGQSWLLDLDKTKYPQLFKLLQDGVNNEMWLTTESQERFAAQLSNTDFYVELKTNDTVKNIKSMVGDLGFDTIPFNSFLKNVMNYGWKDDTLKKEVYKEAFRKDPATGNYVNPTTIERVRKSSPYLSISAIGKSFFSTVSDDTVGKVLAGEMLPDDVTRQQRELAKGKYGHLSNLIDQGLSLTDISDTYKTSAARLLERDPNAIDMSQGAYSTAFDFGEEGKKRLMTTSEWEVKLRSDATFGWDKTQNAREEARALSSTIAQAFGRVI